MPVLRCPPAAELERLHQGGLPDQEADLLEQHVLECSACLKQLKAMLPASDLLSEALAGSDSGPDSTLPPVVEDLITKLSSLRTGPTHPSPRAAPMIGISCSSCRKKLSVKETLAGKKVKCPGCGQVLLVPAQVAAPVASADPGLLPPKPAAQESPAADGTDPTRTPLSRPDATRDFARSGANHNSGLTDFLSPPQADDELGRLGQYRILSILGHGGMGVVFKAEDPKLKRLVALKAMLPALAASPSAGQRFLREAQAMAAVKHDHVVTIHQVDEERGVPFLAMEFLAGEPLDERLKREEKLPLAEVLRIGREIAAGLAAAHATGLIHRDIKPGNIWLEERGQQRLIEKTSRDRQGAVPPPNPPLPDGRGSSFRVKILDFGLARASAKEAGLTQQGAIIGTPAYMAPEQGRGEAVDARSDLFSLGVVLYRLCCGQQPFHGNDAVSTLLSVATHQPAPPIRLNPDIPPELSDLVMQLLHKDAERRPASAAEVVQALQTLEQQARPRAARARRGAPDKRRRRPVLVGALVLLLGLVGLGAWTLIRIQSAEGDYVIETDDPDFSFQVSKGAVTLQDSKAKRTYTLKVLRHDKGEHELEATDADSGLVFHSKTFTIKRGQHVALKAWFERKAEGAVQLPKATVTDAWIKEVAALPAEKQVQAVADKLKDLNPGFDGVVMPKIEGGVVTGLQFPVYDVLDISPVRALTGLQSLSCGGHNGIKGKLADLSPVKDMKLTTLYCGYTKVSDLSPLKGMNLTTLNCGATQVTDLSPLKDMPLTELAFAETQVSDLSPLKNMPLTSLMCHFTQVTDLSPLKNMPLTSLMCHFTQVTDLSPLKGLPLTAIACDFKPNRDTEILRSIQTLEKINGKPTKEFWKDVQSQQAAFAAWMKEVAELPAEKQVAAVSTRLKELNPEFDGKVTPTIEGGVVTQLELLPLKVTDISPVRALAGLQVLDVGCTSGKGQLADLWPLKGMNLTGLICDHTQVPDLRPLLDMKLTSLHCNATQVTDLSPLHGMPLKELSCDFKPERDTDILRAIKTLEKINGKPAREVLK